MLLEKNRLMRSSSLMLGGALKANRRVKHCSMREFASDT
jgi:hypothetical protein